MRFLLNLSFRYKVPLWGSLLIVATATIISSTLLLRSYGELKNDLLRDAATQGRTMANTLFPAMLHDQVWRAYEIVKAPFGREPGDSPGQAESFVVLDQRGHVYVSTSPESLPMLADFTQLSPEYAALAGMRLRLAPIHQAQRRAIRDRRCPARQEQSPSPIRLETAQRPTARTGQNVDPLALYLCTGVAAYGWCFPGD